MAGGGAVETALELAVAGQKFPGRRGLTECRLAAAHHPETELRPHGTDAVVQQATSFHANLFESPGIAPKGRWVAAPTSVRIR